MVRMVESGCQNHRAVGRVPSLAAHGALLLALLAGASPALALSGGAGSASLPADSPWAGVGSLSVNGQLFTGTLIAPGYVLTAAHVAGGANPASVVFQTAGGQSFSSVASEIYVNPAYTGSSLGNVPGDPSNHADLAIIKLADAAPITLPSYSLYNGPLVGQVISLVSYGRSTTQATTGANLVDTVFNDTQGVGQTYLFDFDGPDLSTNRLGASVPANGTLGSNAEASLISGDSGSAAFVQVNGQWQLAGINSFAITFAQGPATQGAYGTGGGGIVLSGQQAWIQSVIAPVPEPHSVWMMLGGLLALRGWRRRQAPQASWRMAPTMNSVFVTR